MKKAVMQKWVKALRSGEFRQTANALKDNRGFCCLGVACAIGLAGPDEKKLFVNEDFLSKKAQNFLATKNDGIPNKTNTKMVNRWGFKRIATYIEKNYKRLK